MPPSRDPRSNRSLADHHRAALERESAISPAVIEERGYWTARRPRDLDGLPFGSAQRRSVMFPMLVIPQHDPSGQEIHVVLRPNNPRERKKGGAIKYEQPKDVGLRLDVPPRCVERLRDPSEPLWFTEGAKKADALASVGLVAVNTPGVDGWRSPSAIPDLFGIPLKGRRVVIAYDSDVMAKPAVRRAVEALARWLKQKGAHVSVLDWSRADLPEAAKIGVDDFLADGKSRADLERLVVPFDAWLAAREPKAPTVELLDEAPAVLDRPLVLINGVAYAASWPMVRRTVSETVVKGEVVPLDPPRIETRRELVIVRGDGVMFGPGGDRGLGDLGLAAKLTDPIRAGKEWRVPSIKAYRDGVRPVAVDVFERLVRVYDHYVDFDRSITDQRSMCELVACFSLVTWFLSAFTVVGYPWFSGDRGSGKTKCGTVWALTSYLGEIILSSGSFAALRDLADARATMLFDDAESFGDARRADPQKRELLLAGNRVGATVAVKEPGPDRTWVTRWVDAFAPRGFTSINLPDPVLASRSILAPLARTADPVRANRDPGDLHRWPVDRQALVDDLWALALWLLPEAKEIWAELESEVEVSGREWEPWRALVAVARLLERHGVEGLEARLRTTMRTYRREKPDLLSDDRTLLVVRAVHNLSTHDTCDTCDGRDTCTASTPLTSSKVADAIQRLAAADGIDGDWASPSRVGKILASLRVPKVDRQAKTRGWLVCPRVARALARAYGIDPELEEPDDVDVHIPDGPGVDTRVMSVTHVNVSSPIVPTNGMATSAVPAANRISDIVDEAVHRDTP